MDSDSEDGPRKLLSKSRDYYILNMKDNGTFKMHEFKPPMVRNAHGQLEPFRGVMAIRPVPRPSALHNAREAMSNGANGIWTATNFVPPAAETPQNVFPVRQVAGSSRPFQRFCLRRLYAGQYSPAGIKTMCVFTDGACTNNGSTDPAVVLQAGCGFVFHRTEGGSHSFPLETEGPDGVVHPRTSNRAELRAAVGALEFRGWWGEGWERIVIVTDSTYVASGATEWMRTWAGRKWVTSSGSKVQNKDLWKLLSTKMGEYAEGGCEVSFWVVPRKWNEEADQAASEGATRPQIQKYVQQTGVMV